MKKTTEKRLAEIKAFKNTNFSDCSELTNEQLAQMKPSHYRKQPRYNAETETAMQEARNIMSGKKKIKKYSSTDELFAELDAEYEAESNYKKTGR
jgi:hypothetical protein